MHKPGWPKNTSTRGQTVKHNINWENTPTWQRGIKSLWDIMSKKENTPTPSRFIPHIGGAQKPAKGRFGRLPKAKLHKN